MLEVRDYGIGELREILGTKEKQGIDRKLKGYGFEFCSTGLGERRIYTIKSIPDPFRIYAITKLGVPPQADFTIIRNLYFYFFCVEGFAEMPYVEMEAILEADGKKISSKTISKWLKYLETLEYVSFSRSGFIYYSITKENGIKCYKEISRELYLEGWHIYFDCKDEEGTHCAYVKMTHHIGGHPYKKAQFTENLFHLKDIEELIETINDSFLDE